MAIQVIEKHYSFSKPGTRNETISVDGRILKGTAVLRGIEPSFPNGADHHVKQLRMQILGVAVVEGQLRYQLDFLLADNDGHTGQCNFDVLVIIDVDTESSLSISPQAVTFSSPGDTQVKVPFFNTVRSAAAALQGFDMRYSDGKDHHVQTIGVEVQQVRIVDGDTAVEADVAFRMNDNGSNTGTATVNFVVLADLGAK